MVEHSPHLRRRFATLWRRLVPMAAHRGLAATCYLILREKAERMRDDSEIQAALAVAKTDQLAEPTRPAGGLDAIRSGAYDEAALASQGYGHERLDQLVTELLLGVR